MDTLGYRLRESALPVGREVYVLGEATDASGELLLRQPRRGRGRFVISVRSKEELLREAEREARQHLKRALSLGAVGLLLLVLPF